MYALTSQERGGNISCEYSRGAIYSRESNDNGGLDGIETYRQRYLENHLPIPRIQHY